MCIKLIFDHNLFISETKKYEINRNLELRNSVNPQRQKLWLV